MASQAEPRRRHEEVAADKRKLILRAAVEVFAERGFHKTRVSDIAKKAGVAYGLIYHYFQSKDEVLNSVFEVNWAVFLKVLREIAQSSGKSTGEKLTSISDLLIDALRINPALIQVMIQEVSRSDRFGQPKKVEAFRDAVSIIRGIVAEGQQNGDVRRSLDASLTAFVFFGALETLCTGFTLKAIPCASDEEAGRLKRSFSTTLLAGILEPAFAAGPTGSED
jgi:TetR/AcrR family fatty acid metabolism transcriptional regulator